MSANTLPVPHRLQKEDGYCLPACVEMVLAYLGISLTQEEIGRRLDLRHRLGIPAFKIKEDVPIGDFLLAWIEMDNRYATIQLHN